MQQWYQCPRCGISVTFGTRFCGSCGTQLNWQQTQPSPVYQQQPPTTWSQQSMPAPNTSGQGKAAIVPSEIEGWNWGAFVLTWIWGIGNKVWISFLTWIPIPLVNLIVAIVLGAKGSKWAWQHKRWDNVEQFKKTQRTWRNWGIGLLALYVVFFIFGAYFVYNNFVKEKSPVQPLPPATGLYLPSTQ